MAISFKGGVRLNEYREKTNTCDSKPVASCRTHVYPLTGDNGEVYVPVVKAGDEVKVGQKIAQSADNWELPMHSSVSGRVEGIRETADGKTEAVVIANNELFEAIEAAPVTNDYTNADEKTLILALQNSGIADMEGGEFICGETLLETPPRYLIVSALQTEPYVSALCRRAAENPDEVITGVRIVQRILKARSVYICVSSDAHEAMDAIRGAVRYDEKITVLSMKPKYPQSDRRILVKSVTGRDLEDAHSEGCILTNAEVMYWAGHTVMTGMPVTERIVTVGGSGILEPDNFRVPFGVPVSFLIEQAKGLIDTPERIVVNGLMSGAEQPDAETIVTKGISSVQVMLPEKERRRTGRCIRCGRCVKHCPMSLMPFKLNAASVDFKVSKAVNYGIYDCIGCGVCTYACPAGLPIMENIRDMADSVRVTRGKEAASENE